MKYTIAGFQQKEIVKMGLNIADAYILRWVVEFWHTGKMTTILNDDKEYLWIKYDRIITDLPSLEITSKRTIENRFKKYVACGLMEHYTHKAGGTYSCYRFTDLYYKLSEYSDSSNLNDEGVVSGVTRGSSVDLPTKDSPINDSLINNNIYLPLSKLLYTEHKKHDDKFLVNKNLDSIFTTWSNDIRLLIEKDQRTYEEVEAVIKYCQSDGCFWIPNILSGKKLREKFDRLVIQYKEKTKTKQSSIDPGKQDYSEGWS